MCVIAAINKKNVGLEDKHDSSHQKLHMHTNAQRCVWKQAAQGHVLQQAAMFPPQEASASFSVCMVFLSALSFSRSQTNTRHAVTSCITFRPEGRRVTQLYVLRSHCRHAQ